MIRMKGQRVPSARACARTRSQGAQPRAPVAHLLRELAEHLCRRLGLPRRSPDSAGRRLKSPRKREHRRQPRNPGQPLRSRSHRRSVPLQRVVLRHPPRETRRLQARMQVRKSAALKRRHRALRGKPRRKRLQKLQARSEAAQAIRRFSNA